MVENQKKIEEQQRKMVKINIQIFEILINFVSFSG